MNIAITRTRVIGLAFTFLALTAGSSFAGPGIVRLRTDDLESIRREIPVGSRKQARLPLVDGNSTLVQLERFEVFAPDAKIIQHTPSGDLYFPIPKTNFYRGQVEGDKESVVFLAVDAEVKGLVVSQGHVFSVEADTDLAMRGFVGVQVHEIDPDMDLPPGAKPFGCDLDRWSVEKPIDTIRTLAKRADPLALSPTTTYLAKLSIEIDDELFTVFGNNATTAATYAAQLVGAANVIYNRDLKTNLSIGTLHTYGGGTDPWTVQPPSSTLAALGELGRYYHNNRSGESRSSAVLMSGKSFGGGVAWIGTVCGGDFFCGADGSSCNGGVPNPDVANSYAGGYAFIGSAFGTVTTNLSSSLVWDLFAFSHELGHNFGSPHTHCIALTGTDITTYGRSFVDLCYGAESGCYAGFTSVPPEKGTIMSYCHLLGGFTSTRLIFGQTGEASYKVAPPMISDIDSHTPALGLITAPASVTASSTGNTASIPNPGGGIAILWTINGGTITGGATATTVTFTAGASGSLALTVAITNASGCGQTDSKTVPITGGLLPPTNVVASATSTTSAQVTWTAAAGAVSYEVSRSTNNSTFTAVCGNPTPACPASSPFTDSNASANTAYIYKVKSVDAGSNKSAFSNGALATTVIFTDDPLIATTTVAKAAHIAELRTAINAVRTLAGLGAGTYTDGSLAGITVKAVHINDLRTALTATFVPLGLSMTYTDSPTVTAGTTIVKAVHIQELRNFVK